VTPIGRRVLLAGAALLAAAPAGAGAQAPYSTIEFPSKDGLVVTADLYRAADSTAPVFLLFHQSGSSRGEYRTIGPRHVEMGYNALAVDLRWGRMDKWNGIPNETAKRNNTQPLMDAVNRGDRSALWPTVLASVGDMEAAMAWLAARGFTGALYVMGSSVTAMTIFQLAHDHPDRVAAVLSFSPGEYHDDDSTMVRRWARTLRMPVLIAGAADEVELVTPIYEVLPKATRTLWIAPEDGHGASLLFKHEGAWEAIRTALEKGP